MSKTILLIHGAWLTPDAWDLFKGRYEEKGFTVVTPAWPTMDRPASELRNSPDKALKRLSITQLVEHHAAIVRGLAERPIIMGHSFGGLITQLLLDRGYGACGVALDPALIAGVPPTPGMLGSALPVFLSPLSWSRTLKMSFESFSRTFANGLPEAEQRAAYDRFIVPAPGRIYWLDALGLGSSIKRGNKERAPLLLVAGENDRTVTPSAVRAVYRKQLKSPSLTELQEFPGRSHFLMREPGWQEVADTCLLWALRNAR